MRAIRGLAAFAVVASLGACAQSTSMPDIGLFGGGPEPTAAPAPAAPPKQVVAEKPAANAPAASRNAKKAAPAKGSTAVAAAKAPAAPANTAAKEQESSGSGLSFGSLSQMTLFTGSTTPDSVETRAAPVATYSMLAQRIHACWFTPGKPQLTNHGFHAEVAPNGSGDAKIIIYEKGPDNKRGIQVFRITISGSGSSSSVVSSENRRLDAKLDAAFKADLARWAKGDDRCKS